MCEYHDNEYGKIKADDLSLFEKLCLECFQAGLSWRTVLYKRVAFRQRFYGFDIEKVAAMTEQKVAQLLEDTAIIRNRRKIEAVIHNAKMHLEYFSQCGSFTAYVYSHKKGEALSVSLKQKGYRFVGPTICESFLMSVGAIEGHESTCFLYKGDN